MGSIVRGISWLPLATLLVLAIQFANPYAPAQEPANPTSSTPNFTPQDTPSNHTATLSAQPVLWKATSHELVRSLAELRRLEQARGLQSFQVAFDAQLTFAAKYWNVFYVQAEGHPALIQCTDAVTELLHAQPVGQWVRIEGLVYAGQNNITLVSIKLLDGPEELPATPLASIASSLPLPIDAYVKTQCQLVEAYDNLYQVKIAATLDDHPLELFIQGQLRADQLEMVRAHANVVATGTISPQQLAQPSRNFSVRMMSQSQLQFASGDLNDGTPESLVNLSGQVLYSDTNAFILVGDKSGVHKVYTHFANEIQPGRVLTLSGHTHRSQPNLANSMVKSPITAFHIRHHKDEPLQTAVPLKLSGAYPNQRLPERATLEAQIVRADTLPGMHRYAMKAGNVKLTAIVHEERTDLVEPLRTGDRVRVTGTPLLEPATDSLGYSVLAIYVVRPEDVQFLSTPFQLSLSHLFWASSVGLLIFGLVIGWNWMLRQQVTSRTEHLNKLSSQLQLSFDAISEAVLVNDPSGRVAGCNRRYEQLFGYMPEDGQLVLTALDAIRSRLIDASSFSPLLRAWELRLKDPLTLELQLEQPEQTVHAFMSAIIDKQGNCQGHLWSFADVTEKQRLEADLVQSQKMEAVGRLSGGIAHDFNNLLTIMKSNLSLMRLKPDAHSEAECLQALEIAVDRGAKLTQQLLAFSRRSRLEYRIVNINGIVGNVLRFLQRSFDPTIVLQALLYPQPLHARVDPNRLEQVLINLCINARDALEGNAGTIQLRTLVSTDDSTQRCIIIEVEDDGCGMTAEVQRRIFEPFFTTKKTGEGTGLGLSMAHGVIEQCGGSIQCRSQLHRGSCFRIKLPLITQNVQVDSEETVVDNKVGSALKVLLVDDEELVRRSGQALLNVLGHHVTAAACGQEALQLIEQQSFDAVLLDLTMPMMSGREVYQAIRERHPRLPVAICTGYLIETQPWLNDLQSEPPQILQKPYTVDSLLGFLATANQSSDTQPA